MIKNLLFSFFVLISCSSLYSQELISSQWLTSQTNEFLNAQFGFNIFNYDVNHFKIEYTTLDVNGQLDTASGLLSIPIASDKAFPLLCYQHGTVGSKDDVPSNLEGGYQLNELWASVGYMAFAPDFLGLGEARGFHPYVHRASEAWAAIDMRSAVIEYLDANDHHINDQFFITGYSQGGHAAAALHKEVEENYSTEIAVTASAPMSGPYSVSGVMNDFMYAEIPYNFVAYLPYTILGYQTAYGNLFNNLEDVFKPDYANEIADFYSGAIDLGDLNQNLIAMLTQDFGASIPLKMLQDSVINNVANMPNHPFNVALRDNDVHEWAPQAPTRLYYCKADDQVPFMNSVVADSVMNSMGAIDTEAIDLNSDFDHGECVQPAMINAFIFFAEFAQIDDILDVFNPDLDRHVSIFPNPTNELFYIKSEREEGIAQLFNSNGKLLLEQRINFGTNEISVNNLPNGVYWVKVNFGNEFINKKVILIND